MIAIRWAAKAQDQLARIWIAADSDMRREITRSIGQIESELRLRPHLIGEGDPNGLRRTNSGRIGIEFEIREADSFVHVVRIWRIKSSP